MVSVGDNDVANAFTYTGRQFDAESGIYQYRFRYYHAQLGRFVGRDPAGYVDGMSLYRAFFIPHSLDPSGLACTEGWIGQACFEITKFHVKGKVFGNRMPPFIGDWENDKWWILQSGYYTGTIEIRMKFDDKMNCCCGDYPFEVPVSLNLSVVVDVDYIQLNTRLGIICGIARSVYAPAWFNTMFYTGPMAKDIIAQSVSSLRTLGKFDNVADFTSDGICPAARLTGLSSINAELQLRLNGYKSGTPPMRNNSRYWGARNVEFDLGGWGLKHCLNPPSEPEGFIYGGGP